ncbi:MAG: methylenetetrahydrofolate reductase [Lachnospiraceae bacterium]|nr:methylenetetrahydrofolate reductase [NAD(P)H] [Lachnospiraceae bacterium]
MIKDKYNKKTIFSCEVFPPKRNDDIYDIFKTLDEIKLLNPDFISVTYGAGGSNSKKTATIAAYIQNICEIEALAHVTAVGLDENSLTELLSELKRKQVQNVLALRGDKPRTMTEEEFEGRYYKHASDLIKVIKDKSDDMYIAAACYPEIHPESKSREDDIKYLKLKADYGVDSFITQMFFDNDILYRFLEDIRSAGINVPVHAGIMPITKVNQLGTSVSLSGSSVPKKLSNLIAKYSEDPEGMKKAGTEYAIDQVTDLIAHGVEGIHIYSMNKSDVTSEIYKAAF